MHPRLWLFFVILLLGTQIPTFFPIQKTIKSPEIAPQLITLVAGGDVMLGRSINTRSLRLHNYTWPFEHISQEFNQADIAIINLESPLSPSCPITDTGMTFCAPQEHLEGLGFAGVDIVNIANNHAGDQGNTALNFTVSSLKQFGISAIGIDADIRNIKGVKFGFLGFDVLGNFNQDNIRKQIVQLKAQVDVLVVSFHWGTEYTSSPNEVQKQLARLSVDSGADLVLGHHPHWVQEKEIYLGKPIYYSLGNLIFDQSWSENTKEGLVAKIYYSGKNYLTSQDLQVKLDNYGQPRFVTFQTQP